MFFTQFGRVVAVLALAMGIWQVAGGFSLVFGGFTPEEIAASLRRYFGRFETTGALINRGMYTILFAIAFGIATEISRNIRALIDKVIALQIILTKPPP